MTLQEIYNNYVEGRRELKEVQIYYRDKVLNNRIKSSKTEAFFNLSALKASRGDKCVLEDTNDYPIFDDATFEIINDSYEKDWGDGVTGTIPYDILRITLKEAEPDIKDYEEAVKTLKERLNEAYEEKDVLRKRAGEIESFLKYPSKTSVYCDMKDAVKYVYGISFYEAKKNDNISEGLFADLIKGYKDEEEYAVDFLKHLDDKNYCVDILDECVDAIFDRYDIKDAYDCRDEEEPPRSTEVAEDYFAQIKDGFTDKASEDDFKRSKKFKDYNSYTKARMQFKIFQKEYPQLAFYEKEITSDGKISITILETYRFFDEVENKEE